VRGLSVLGTVAVLVAGLFFADAASARSGYPSLHAGPPGAPEIVYMPLDVPREARPVSLRVGRGVDGSIDLEALNQLGDGGTLRIIETTRYGALAKDLVGPYWDQGRARGTHMKWTLGTTYDSTNLIYGWLGQTLVVISAHLTFGELLLIGDSLRGTSPSALML
jgi:hypothetical protein